MKAIVFHEHGSVSELALENFPDPIAGPMDVILRVVLPKELTLRGVDDADAVSEAIATTLQTANLAEDQRADSPEAVFSRLAG